MARTLTHTHTYADAFSWLRTAIDHSKYTFIALNAIEAIFVAFYLYVSIEQHSSTKIKAAAISQFQASERKLNEIENLKKIITD